MKDFIRLVPTKKMNKYEMDVEHKYKIDTDVNQMLDEWVNMKHAEPKSPSCKMSSPLLYRRKKRKINTPGNGEF